MVSENIIGFMIYLLVAAVMIGIGISQVRSKKPVGFYSGEQPPTEKELTNVIAWNKKHGMMWIVYGLIIVCSFFVGLLVGDTPLSTIPMCGGVIIPIFIMIGYHHALIKKYYK